MNRLQWRLGAALLSAMLVAACLPEDPDKDRQDPSPKDKAFTMSKELKKTIHEYTRYSQDGADKHRHKGFTIAFTIEKSDARSNEKNPEDTVDALHPVFCRVTAIMLTVEGENNEIPIELTATDTDNPYEIQHCIDN